MIRRIRSIQKTDNIKTIKKTIKMTIKSPDSGVQDPDFLLQMNTYKKQPAFRSPEILFLPSEFHLLSKSDQDRLSYQAGQKQEQE